MTTLSEQARITASMIALGERIAHGRDVDLLLQLAAIAEAQADVITRLKYEVDAIPGIKEERDECRQAADEIAMFIQSIKVERDALMSAAKLARKALALIGEELNDVLLLGHQSPFSRNTTLKTREAIAALKSVDA